MADMYAMGIVTDLGADAVRRYLYGGSFLLSTDRRWSETREDYVYLHTVLVASIRGEDAERSASMQADRLRSATRTTVLFRDSFAQMIADIDERVG